MRARRARHVLAACLGALAPLEGAQACQVQLIEHRSGRPVAHVPLPPDQRFALAFEHSVLGSTVRDEFRVCASEVRLTATEFGGEGYGLPTGGPTVVGETVHRDRLADGRTRLVFERTVTPLIVWPSAAQGTRIAVAGRPAMLLHTLTETGLRIEPHGCRCP